MEIVLQLLFALLIVGWEPATAQLSPAPTTAPTKVPTASPTLRPTQRPTVYLADLKAWNALYDFTNGAEWTFCSEYRDDPCSCNADQYRFVECNGATITKIHLESNNMIGYYIPNAKLSEMSALREFILTNDAPGLPNSFSAYENEAFPCIEITGCTKPDAVCQVADGIFCFETKAPTFKPTATPTSKPLHSNDVALWQSLYDNAGGSNWVAKCSREDPCKCSDGSKRFVRCVNGRITEIVLPSNNMIGVLTVATFISEMPDLTRIDFSSTNNDAKPNTFSNTRCVLLPECSSSSLTCDFSNSGVGLCSSTESPTNNPTRRPTVRPTQFPTTRAPTTKSPTLNPTRFPSQSPTQSPTYSKHDYLCQIRFVRAYFDEITKDKNLHLGYLRRAFPEAEDIEIVDVHSGSVIVQFILINHSGAQISNGLQVTNAVINAMNPSEKAILPTTDFELEYLSPPQAPGTSNGDVVWPTMSPTQLYPTGPPNTGNSLPATMPTQAPTEPVVKAETIVAWVIGGAAGLSILALLVHKARKPSEKHTARKASWKMNDEVTREIERQRSLTIIPSQKSVLAAQAPEDSPTFDYDEVEDDNGLRYDGVTVLVPEGYFENETESPEDTGITQEQQRGNGSPMF